MPHGLPPPFILTTSRKRWWRSRTLWFNAVVAALATAELSLHVLQPLLGQHTYPVIAFGLAVGNAMLRLLTTQGLGLAAPPVDVRSAPAANDGAPI
jgi:hypothetical protein